LRYLSHRAEHSTNGDEKVDYDYVTPELSPPNANSIEWARTGRTYNNNYYYET